MLTNREFHLQTGNLAYKTGFSFTKRESWVTKGILGLLFTLINSLTIIYDKNIIHYDKQSCQTDKNNQQEMGRLCGVSRQTISLIERGDYSPSVTLALTIAKVCGVTVEDVFYLQEEDEDEDGEK